MTTITIAVPAYNEEKYLPSCLEAIRKQDYKGKYELLVVDNDSSDNTPAIARKYGAAVVKEKKKGMLFAKHRCFLSAKGEIVATTDADTIVPANWLSRILDEFNKDSSVIAVTGLVAYSKNDHGGINYSDLDRFFQKMINKFRTAPFTMRGPNRAIKKSVYRRAGGIDTRGSTMEDEYFLLQKIKKYGKVVFLPDLIVTTSNRRTRKRFVEYFLKDILWEHLFNGFAYHLTQKPSIIPVRDFR